MRSGMFWGTEIDILIRVFLIVLTVILVHALFI